MLPVAHEGASGIGKLACLMIMVTTMTMAMTMTMNYLKEAMPAKGRSPVCWGRLVTAHLGRDQGQG